MREKLIELLEEAPGHASNEVYSFGEIADHLIANGVIVDDGSLPKIVGKKNCRFGNGKWVFNIRLKWQGKDWCIAHEIPTDDLCSTFFMKKMAENYKHLYDQVKKERDAAIDQLEKHGIKFDGA